MYAHFYQLAENPFNLTPDPKFHYINESTREAMASILHGIKARKGFITLIGEAGTGKTTLLKRLVEEIEGETKVVFVFNPGVSFDELLEFICTELGIEVGAGRRLHLLEKLNAYLLDQLTEGRNVVVMIDEAQTLEDDVLEELRLLSNLETSKEKILQILLSGQPELEEKLRRPHLRQLRQRIAARATLRPMQSKEMGAYVETRMRSAGAERNDFFTPRALKKIWQVSSGIPRVINVICDNAMMIAFAEGKRQITAPVLKEAIRDLQGEADAISAADTVRLVTQNPYARYAAVAALILAVGVPLALSRGGDWVGEDSDAMIPAVAPEVARVPEPSRALPPLPTELLNSRQPISSDESDPNARYLDGERSADRVDDIAGDIGGDQVATGGLAPLSDPALSELDGDPAMRDSVLDSIRRARLLARSTAARLYDAARGDSPQADAPDIVEAARSEITRTTQGSSLAAAAAARREAAALAVEREAKAAQARRVEDAVAQAEAARQGGEAEAADLVAEAIREAEEAARVADAALEAEEAVRQAEAARVAAAVREAEEAARQAEAARVAAAAREAEEAARQAEAARVAAAAREAEEAARQAETARVAAAAREAEEAARQAEAARVAAAAREAEEAARQAEATRVAAAAREAEEAARVAEAARKAEEAERLAAKAERGQAKAAREVRSEARKAKAVQKAQAEEEKVKVAREAEQVVKEQQAAREAALVAKEADASRRAEAAEREIDAARRAEALAKKAADQAKADADAARKDADVAEAAIAARATADAAAQAADAASAAASAAQAELGHVEAPDALAATSLRSAQETQTPDQGGKSGKSAAVRADGSSARDTVAAIVTDSGQDAGARTPRASVVDEPIAVVGRPVRIRALGPSEGEPLIGHLVQVEEGDTVWDIAVKQYGDAVPSTLDRILESNPRVGDAKRLSVGAFMYVPFQNPDQMISRDGEDGYRVLVSAAPVPKSVEESRTWVRGILGPIALGTATVTGKQPVYELYAVGLPTHDAAFDIAVRVLSEYGQVRGGSSRTARR